MVFIATCSQDSTVDLLYPYIKELTPFRFNIDKPEDYRWDFSRKGFEITNIITNSTIDSKTLSSFYLRKPMYITQFDVPMGGDLGNWCRKEIDALFEDFYRECEFRKQTTVIHSRNTHFGKLRQMYVAEKHFKVAHWHIFHGVLPNELTQGKWVAKALTGTAIGKGKVFFVREVTPTELNLGYPWFLQEKLVGEYEVTVVYLNGQTFAYQYPRSQISESDDVRKATIEDDSLWKPCELSSPERSAIQDFMSETGYRFGRFDFIRKDGELWFLELNPNGQWAWLDKKNENGLISSIADAIISEDRAASTSAW